MPLGPIQRGQSVPNFVQKSPGVRFLVHRIYPGVRPQKFEFHGERSCVNQFVFVRFGVSLLRKTCEDQEVREG